MSVYFNPYFSKMQAWKGKPIDRDSIQKKSLEINTKAKFNIQDTVFISGQGKAATTSIEETEQVASTGKSGGAVDTGKTVQAEGILSVSNEQGAEGTMLPELRSIYYEVEPLMRCREVIEEYYAKRNEENKKFADPLTHIQRKYWDSDYEYYEKGLTEQERQDGCSQERSAYYGLPLTVSRYDPAVIRTFGEPLGRSNAEAGLMARKDMDGAINQIFKEYGIVIPEGADLRLTVDPYDCLIRVSGVDEDLAGKIEAALNQGKNGETLYSHIYMSDPGQATIGIPSSPQFSQGNPWKTSLWLAVEASTGYDLRELERKDGKFLTPDGQDVWELVNDEYKIDEHYHTYRTLAIRGWDVTGDENLSIGYKDGHLYDIDTDYGYGPGQTAWVDREIEAFEKRQEGYMKEREETLRREESMPNSYERAFASARTRDGRLVSEVLYGSDAGLSSEGTVMGAQGTGWLSEGIFGGNQVTLFDFMNQNRSETNLFELLKGSVSTRNPEMAMKIAQMSNVLSDGAGSLL